MNLTIETSFDSLNKYGEELCGDKVEVVKTPDETILVLADGLGSGVKANILSSLSSKIIATMLAQGAKITEAVQTMAETLPVCKQRKIAYSTFSILRVRNNGDAMLVEYDNPAMVLLRKGKQMNIDYTQQVVEDKVIQQAKFKVQPDDLCVIFSDGVVHAGVGQLLNYGWQRDQIISYLEDAYQPGMTAHTLQSQLLEACDNLYMGTPGDDATVVACRVRTPSVAHIMVGPPVDRQDDAQVVRRLMASPDKKVVCGGTTSQIVSRVLDKELKVQLNYISPDVPPTGSIEGIDLVTEGVVTLGKTLAMLNRYESGTVVRDEVLYPRKDGAAQLAHLLTQECTEIHFFVGRAINPAHQNPDLPIDLNLKLRIVEDMARVLRQLDKNVTVAYY